jgi:hypothetical protein
MNLSEIPIRDPFVLPMRESGEYFLFGSTDKNNWNGPGVASIVTAAVTWKIGMGRSLRLVRQKISG